MFEEEHDIYRVKGLRYINVLFACLSQLNPSEIWLARGSKGVVVDRSRRNPCCVGEKVKAVVNEGSKIRSRILTTELSREVGL